MKLRILAALAMLWPALALAQTSPNLTYGQVPTPGQWNSYFAAKQDVLGYTPVNRAGDTMFGTLKTLSPTGNAAGLVVTPGLAPSSPADGSIWVTNTGIFTQINGSTIGPLGAGTINGPGITTAGNVVTWGNATGTALQDIGKAAPAGDFVGTSDAQTLTNKSISAAQINSGTLAPAQLPALTGDVTSSAGTAATTIAAGSVTSAKMATGAAVANIGFTPLNRASNLSDVANVATSRTNLGLGSVATLNSVSLTTNVTGTLPVANGGTGQTTFFGAALLLGNNAGPIDAIAMGSGSLLVGQGAGTKPTAPVPSGDLTMSSTGVFTVTKTSGTAFGTAATKNVGTSASNVVQLDGSARYPAADGSQITNLPGVISVPVRQTVLSGPASSGLPSFLPATTGTLSIASQNVSTGASALTATAANGFGTNGAVNVIGQATSNLTWPGLNASTTNYLGVTISGGALTPFSTTVAPIYQFGGTVSVTNGQYTFDIVAMQMYLGNGTVANPVNAVFVGEVVTSATAVTSSIAYAYRRFYRYVDTGSFPSAGTAVSKAHNIGTSIGLVGTLSLVCAVAEGGYNVGDVVTHIGMASAGPWYSPLSLGLDNYNAKFASGSNVAFLIANPTNGTVLTAPTLSRWRYAIQVSSTW